MSLQFLGYILFGFVKPQCWSADLEVSVSFPTMKLGLQCEHSTQTFISRFVNAGEWMWGLESWTVKDSGVPLFYSPKEEIGEPEGVEERPPSKCVNAQKFPWNWISQNIVSSAASPGRELLWKERGRRWGSPYLNTGWDLANQRQQCVKHYSTFWLSCSVATSPTLFKLSTQTVKAGSTSLDGPIKVLGWCFCSWFWSFEDPSCPRSSLPFPSLYLRTTLKLKPASEVNESPDPHSLVLVSP